MRLLVLANGNFVGVMYQNISGLQGRIGEQSRIYVVGLCPYFVFESGAAFQLAQIGIHIQKQIQFCRFG
jgi:hypothetical protein